MGSSSERFGSEAHLSEEALIEEIAPRNVYHILLDKVADGVYFVDRERRIRFWNHAAERLTGFTSAQVLGSSCADAILVHVDERGALLCRTSCPVVATMEDGEDRTADVFLRHREGHRVPVRVRTAAVRDRHGRIIGVVETFQDNSAQIADLERIRHLEQVASLDPLTGLANRRYLDNIFEARFAEVGRGVSAFGVILADIDWFKPINDTHGHDVGDRVLQMVARTLAHNCRPYDIVGRWGGEEFLVIAAHSAAEEVRDLAERLRALVAQSRLDHQGMSIGVTASFGATVARRDDSASILVQRADELLYRSKEEGRNRVTFSP